MAQGSFSAKISSWVKETRERRDAVYRGSAQEVLRRAQFGGNLPVKTGFLRASLVVSPGYDVPLATYKPDGVERFTFDETAINGLVVRDRGRRQAAGLQRGQRQSDLSTVQLDPRSGPRLHGRPRPFSAGLAESLISFAEAVAGGTAQAKLPPLHPAVTHLWFAFVDLQATRERGLAIGPITWAEINAYDAGALAGLSAWDKRLIRRCDDAYEAVRTGIKQKPTNVAGLKASLRAAIAARNAMSQPKGDTSAPS